MRRTVRRYGVKRLPSGARLVTNNQNDFVDEEIEVEKSAGELRTRSEVAAEMVRVAARLTGLPESIAMAKVNFAEPELLALADLHDSLPPDRAPASVAKSEEPGSWVWDRVVYLAKRLRESQPGALTEAESIEAVLEKRPDLAEAYRYEYRAAQG